MVTIEVYGTYPTPLCLLLCLLLMITSHIFVNSIGPGIIFVDIFLSLNFRDATIACFESLLVNPELGMKANIMMTSSNGNIFRVTGHLCGKIHRSPVKSPHKGQWRRALMFSLICVRIHGWVNSREAGDLRRYRAHYDVTVMITSEFYIWTFHCLDDHYSISRQGQQDMVCSGKLK